MERRPYINFGFQYAPKEVNSYPWISLYSVANDIDVIAAQNPGFAHGTRIIATWKVIKFKRGPAPQEQWWWNPPKPIPESHITA